MMIVDEEYRVNIYLDTNILVDYIEGTYPLLNKSIDYLHSCPFVNLRSSHYVLFEYTEVRKYNLFMSKSNKTKYTSFKDKLYSLFSKKDRELDKDAIKAKIKRTWNRNSVDYNHFKAEIIDIIQEELNLLKNKLDLDFDEHVLHEALVFPTNSLCLSTKISKEDCLVMVSCMHPKEEEKLGHCLLLSRDDQYYRSYQNNINDVDAVFQASNLVLPQFIHTNKIKYHQNKQLNLYTNGSIDVEEVWNDIICTALKSKHSDSYIGETYSFGKSGISAQCVYFDTKNPNITLQESEGLLFISKDLKTKISIADPFEYMNNGNKITLPHRNPQFTKYSFLPNSVTSDALIKLRQKGNLVFYENY